MLIRSFKILFFPITWVINYLNSSKEDTFRETNIQNIRSLIKYIGDLAANPQLQIEFHAYKANKPVVISKSGQHKDGVRYSVADIKIYPSFHLTIRIHGEMSITLDFSLGEDQEIFVGITARYGDSSTDPVQEIEAQRTYKELFDEPIQFIDHCLLVSIDGDYISYNQDVNLFPFGINLGEIVNYITRTYMQTGFVVNNNFNVYIFPSKSKPDYFHISK